LSLHPVGDRKSGFRSIVGQICGSQLLRSRCVYEVVVSGANHVKKLLVSFVEDEAGLTMVEYAVAGALVTAAAVAAFTGLGGAVVARITFLVTALNT
jgi:pilus assembly protein Flp/PilA